MPIRTEAPSATPAPAASAASDRRARLRGPVVLSVLVAAAVSAACASGPPPVAGEGRGYVPSLQGRRVMVFPVQRNFGVDGDPTAELSFALAGPGAGPDWILPDEMEAILTRSPALNAPLRDLPVDVFLRSEVQRIGDPIFGVLLRIGAVTNAELALLPVAIRPGAPPVDSAGRPMDGPVALEFVATLIDVRTGRILWFGVEGGRPGTPDDPSRLVSAAEALARRLVPPPAPRRAPEPVP